MRIFCIFFRISGDLCKKGYCLWVKGLLLTSKKGYYLQVKRLLLIGKRVTASGLYAYLCTFQGIFHSKKKCHDFDIYLKICFFPFFIGVFSSLWVSTREYGILNRLKMQSVRM